MIGGGIARPTITSSAKGPIISIDLNANVTIEHLEAFGATNEGVSAANGFAIACHPPGSPDGARTVHVIDALLHSNQAAGLSSNGCTVSVVTTDSSDNGAKGIALTNSTATIDRSVVSNNVDVGIEFDEGVFALTNSFVTRNPAVGIRIGLLASQTGARFEFNTFVDNGMAVDNLNAVPAISTRNNLFVRNTNVACNACDFAGSLILPDPTAVKFKSPDAAPFDYHIDATSVAVDAAVATTVVVDHDFDGDARPQGQSFDVGADEAH